MAAKISGMISGMQYMGLSALSFSLMAALVKLGGGDIPEQEMILFRSLFIIAVTLPILLRNKIPIFGNQKGLLILRGLFGYIAMSCYFWTLGELPVADAIVIQYISPIFTILFAYMFLKEEAKGGIWLAALLCMVGVVLIAKPEGEGSLLVAAIGLMGAILAGAAYVTVRALRESDNAYTIVFYFPLVSLPFSIIASIQSSQFHIPSTLNSWGILLGICLTSYLGQIFLTKGLEKESASRAILVNYITVAFGLVFGLLMFETLPDLRSLFGILLILVGISWASFRK
ncbi:MAG: DMT family transporter [Candidatus Kapaibacterium sp.]